MRRRFLPLIVLALAALVLTSSSARANGRFPSASQLVVAPTDPSYMVLRTTYGFLASKDSGMNWDWICETAIGYGTNVEDPSIGITANKTVVAGTQEGLTVSANLGCDWHFIGGALDKQPIVDVVVRPDDPHKVYALASKQTSTNDAGDPIYTSQVFVSTDDGVTWNALGAALDPSYILETLEVAKSDPHRLYASGVKGAGASTVATVFVSANDGTTWTPYAVPFDPTNDRAPFVSGVDPTNADRVYVRTSGVTSNKLLVSINGGQTFTTAFTAPLLLGFAQSPDGSTVYVGGPSAGLNVAARADLIFSQKSAGVVQCLTVSGTKIFACSNQTVTASDPNSAFILGESDDNGTTFVSRLQQTGLRGPLACDVDASEQSCVAQWPNLQNILGITADGGAEGGSGDGGVLPTSDAGGTQNDASTGGGGGGGGSSGCGCGATPADAGGIAGLLGLLVVLGMMARRGSTPPPRA